MVKAIFIGDKFYLESGTIMSSVYLESGERYDYGFLQRDLSQGKTVQIRPADAEEMLHYQRRLDDLKQLRQQKYEASHARS